MAMKWNEEYGSAVSGYGRRHIRFREPAEVLEGGGVGKRDATESNPRGLRVEPAKGNALGAEVTDGDQQNDADGVEKPHEQQAGGQGPEGPRKTDFAAEGA